MAAAEVFHAWVAALRWRLAALVSTRQDRVHDHHEGVVVGQQDGVLLAETQLDLLRNLAASIAPVDVGIEIALDYSEGPADGVVVAEVSEPSVEGFGRA